MKIEMISPCFFLLSICFAMSFSNIPSPEELIEFEDNCGLNAIDVVYKCLYPKAKPIEYPRGEIGKSFEKTHAFSFYEMQTLLPRYNIKAEAFKIEEISDLFELLHEDAVAILHLKGNDVGHFIVVRRNNDGQYEMLDYPKPRKFLDREAKIWRNLNLTKVVLVCSKNTQISENRENRFVENTDDHDGGAKSKLVPNPSTKTVASFAYYDSVVAKPSAEDPNELIALVLVRSMTKQAFSISEVKGACSCFKSFSVEVNEDKSIAKVSLAFDRARFDPMRGTSIALLVAFQGDELSSETIPLVATVSSSSAGKLGEPFLVPEIVWYEHIDHIQSELSLYLPCASNSQESKPELLIEGSSIKSQREESVTIGGFDYKKITFELDLDLDMLSNNSIRLSVDDTEFSIPIRKRPSQW